MSLKEKTALVTGGARGIGKAIALKLARQGANVAILDMAMAPDTVKEVEELGVKAISVEANVTKLESVEKAVEQVIATFGRLDMVVNNAGVTRDNLFLRMKPEEWDLVISVNLTGAFNVCKAVNKQMFKQRAGKIVNIASVVGQMGNAGQANYAASKAGLIGLTKTLAREFAARNIQVNAVAPGFINTEMTASLPDDVKQHFINNIPAGSFGSAENVADVVAFLCSADADYVTGQVINVDGGMVMS
ncbi:MAG: 3-oxoacyl-[acyl-carrier-protein] reductase [Betaproteobacteria bacterium]|nr:3-oxoacyl-[acyl-carrier-protein] reductase [Betaproteobacteria bacterium]MDE2310056.1 3-oxoacyl-[acyl-carrier-protein] reductase [Betaproteobacteria bacterium]